MILVYHRKEGRKEGRRQEGRKREGIERSREGREGERERKEGLRKQPNKLENLNVFHKRDPKDKIPSLLYNGKYIGKNKILF